MANEHEGVVFLGYFGSPAAYLWSVDKPFAAVNDLKGVRTWAPPGDQGRALAALGAVIVSGPAVRSYEIISKGIVQAWGGLNFDGSASFNTTQFARAMTIIPGGSGSAMFAVFINKTKWDSIPKRDQDLIMSVSGEEIAKLSKAWDDREAAAYARAKQEGRVQITTASPELVADLKKAWAFLQDEWIANAAKRNVDGRAALKFYFDTVTELSK
jgi:TRAP-type C4-dicarboxylate transport system substrate-binding protein